MATTKKMRNSQHNKQGLRDLCAWLPFGCEGVEIGSYAGESAEIFAQSGKFQTLTCVDSWLGDCACAEEDFDYLHHRWPNMIVKEKLTALQYIRTRQPQSLDFVYLDADHEYQNIKAELDAIRCKIKAGGFIAGHDYDPLHPGVMRAVNETFGRPHAIFQDTSWIVRTPASSFDIVTMCSPNYRKALERCMESWRRQNSGKGMDRIIVYTDDEKLCGFLKTDDLVEWRVRWNSPPTSLHQAFCRKIELLTDHYQYCTTKWFSWLDCDVYSRAPFKDAFFKMGTASVGATRMFNQTRRGHGEANAGVIFFRHSPELVGFWERWKCKTEALALKGTGIWSEQTAFSQLAHEGFHGRHPFGVAALSAEVFNSEADDNKEWFQRMAIYKPKLIHLKARRWEEPTIVEQAIAAAGGDAK